LARKAVAATIASVILFSVLVVANATLMSAQDNLASSTLLASIESRELLLERYSAGSVSVQALAQVQSYLSSNTAECETLAQYLASISASGSLSGVDSGIAYSANATATEARSAPFRASQGDNLTMAAPFSGYVPGALDLQTSISVREAGDGGSVTLVRHEAHILNIPISPGSASSLCDTALGTIAAALSRSPCNSTLEAAAFESVLPGLVEEAAAEGFALTAGWGPGGASCAASYWVTLVQRGVEGVTGSFDWTVHGSGTTD